MREEAIAQQNAERISPPRVSSGLCTPALRFIHNVIVHKGSDMDQFHDHGQIDMARIDLAGSAASEKCQQRAKAFSATAHSIYNVAFNCRIKRRRLLRNAGLNFFEMRLNQFGH
jgi:hypothetical protein